MARTLPVSEVKTHLPELLTGVEEREEEIVVTRRGRPAAVLVNFVEYERLKATLDVLSDPVLMRQIRRSRRYFAAGGKGAVVRASLWRAATRAAKAPVDADVSAPHPARGGRAHPPPSSRPETEHHERFARSQR